LLQSIYIKNFKAWRKGVFKFFGKSAALVGENASGKTSMLEALDFFFNRERMDAACIIDPQRDVEIGVRIDGQNYRKVFDHETLDARPYDEDVDWSAIDSVRYLYVPATGRSASAVALELARARMAEAAAGEPPAGVERAADRALVSLPSGAGASLRVKACAPEALQLGLPGRVDIPDARQLIVRSSYRRLILGIDDIEESELAAGTAEGVSELKRHVGQLVISTNSHGMLPNDPDMLVYAVGDTPGAHVAGTIAGAAGADGRERLFMLVEGQYDLPWYKRAIELLRREGEVQVLPGGGSNVDALCRELRGLDYRCIIVRDGDMAFKSDPSAGDFAIERDCIEMYAPDKLLLDCFGVVPPRTKEAFFERIASSPSERSQGTRTRKARYSNDDIKSIIAEHITSYLSRDSDFVRELASILGSLQ